MLPNENANGSEGDAYRYTKKVLNELPNREILRSIYEEVARNRNISSWTRAAYMDLRAHFFKDGQCKIRFAPGAARIAFGELFLGTGDEELTQIGALHDILRIISIAHSTEYTRHLAPIGGKPMKFAELIEIYGAKVTKDWSALKRKLKRRKYGERRYTIIELDSFETANKYYEYTHPHGWCHLSSQSTFEHYHHVDTANFTGGKHCGQMNMVRLYLAVLPGFETMTVDDELYGESMLGIDIGPGGRLVHVNNRWNHAHDNMDHRKGDNKYDEIELSELLGGPFFEICPPYSMEDERNAIKAVCDERKEQNKPIIKRRKEHARMVLQGRKAGMGEIGEFVDERDGNRYRTRRIGGIECMLDPLRLVLEGRVYHADIHRVWEDHGEEPFDKCAYMFTVSKTGTVVRTEMPYEIAASNHIVGRMRKMDSFNINRNPIHSGDVHIVFVSPYEVVGKYRDVYQMFHVGIEFYAMGMQFLPAFFE